MAPFWTTWPSCFSIIWSHCNWSSLHTVSMEILNCQVNLVISLREEHVFFEHFINFQFWARFVWKIAESLQNNKYPYCKETLPFKSCFEIESTFGVFFFSRYNMKKLQKQIYLSVLIILVSLKIFIKYSARNNGTL